MAVLGTVAGGYFSFKYKKGFLSLNTAFLGGYMFMRGWTYYFGHYPSEMEVWAMMVHGEEVDLTWQVWLYYAVFVFSGLMGYIW